MINGRQRLIDEIEIEHCRGIDSVEGHGREIERTAIALYPVRALDHGTVERVAVQATNQWPALVQDTPPAL